MTINKTNGHASLEIGCVYKPKTSFTFFPSQEHSLNSVQTKMDDVFLVIDFMPKKNEYKILFDNKIFFVGAYDISILCEKVV